MPVWSVRMSNRMSSPGHPVLLNYTLKIPSKRSNQRMNAPVDVSRTNLPMGVV
jgi:hypothetical protein